MVLPGSAAYVLEKLENAGFEAYVVGGCVRDALLGLEPKDYDVCTNALPEQTETAFAGERVIETGLIHGTVTVLIGGQPFEVTTYRVDGDYADHRHPDGVQFVRDLESDLQRRDFTVNAMAYSPRRGLRDPFGGQEDLKRRCIRCVGEAEKRFEEDALRILRALRFAAVYGFEIEKRTADAARARKDELQYVARERVTAELGKLLCGQAAEEIAFAFSDVLSAAMNVLPDAQGLNRVPPELPLRLAHVLRYAPQPERALNALRLDKETFRAVAELLDMRNRTAPPGAARLRAKAEGNAPPPARAAALPPEGLGHSAGGVCAGARRLLELKADGSRWARYAAVGTARQRSRRNAEPPARPGGGRNLAERRGRAAEMGGTERMIAVHRTVSCLAEKRPFTRRSLHAHAKKHDGKGCGGHA